MPWMHAAYSSSPATLCCAEQASLPLLRSKLCMMTADCKLSPASVVCPEHRTSSSMYWQCTWQVLMTVSSLPAIFQTVCEVLPQH